MIASVFFQMLTYFALAHPFFVSVTDINHNEKAQQLEISVRIFADDFEKTLTQYGKAKLDITHPADKNAAERRINQYIQNHLKISVNEQPLNYRFVGYEIQAESAWVYFEIDHVPLVKKLAVVNTVLCDYEKQQINIIHATVRSKEESYKLDAQTSTCSFVF